MVSTTPRKHTVLSNSTSASHSVPQKGGIQTHSLSHLPTPPPTKSKFRTGATSKAHALGSSTVPLTLAARLQRAESQIESQTTLLWTRALKYVAPERDAELHRQMGDDTWRERELADYGKRMNRAMLGMREVFFQNVEEVGEDGEVRVRRVGRPVILRLPETVEAVRVRLAVDAAEAAAGGSVGGGEEAMEGTKNTALKRKKTVRRVAKRQAPKRRVARIVEVHRDPERQDVEMESLSDRCEDNDDSDAYAEQPSPTPAGRRAPLQPKRLPIFDRNRMYESIEAPTEEGSTPAPRGKSEVMPYPAPSTSKRPIWGGEEEQNDEESSEDNDDDEYVGSPTPVRRALQPRSLGGSSPSPKKKTGFFTPQKTPRKATSSAATSSAPILFPRGFNLSLPHFRQSPNGRISVILKRAPDGSFPCGVSGCAHIEAQQARLARHYARAHSPNSWRCRFVFSNGHACMVGSGEEGYELLKRLGSAVRHVRTCHEEVMREVKGLGMGEGEEGKYIRDNYLSIETSFDVETEGGVVLRPEQFAS